MSLQLEIISEHRDLVGADAVHEFGDDGGTIGRSLESDWILPDPDRYISGTHATIDYRGGVYYLADMSTNGVYVNGEREPVGRGNPRRLFNGDHLRMGDFEFVVSIDRGESIAMPLEGERTEYPEPIGTRVPEVAERPAVQLLDESELADNGYHSEFFTGLLKSAGPIAADDTPADTPADSGADDAVDTSADATDWLEDVFDEPAARAASAVTGIDDALDDNDGDVAITADDLFDTFLDGLGLSRADLQADVDLAEVMQNAGLVLREFVEGTSQMLAGRRNVKSQFRLDQTTILPRHNNPVKLAENLHDSLRQLLVGREGEYLGPRDAAREACRDLIFHQDAMLEAMRAALDEFADRFDPDELVQAFRRGGAKSWFGFLDRTKYWPMYCDRYPVLTEKGASHFPQAFAEEFVRVYERQIADFKRLAAVPVLQSTVRLDRNAAARRERPAREAGDIANADPAAAAAPDPAAAAHADDQLSVVANAPSFDPDAVPTIEFDDTFAEIFDDEPAEDSRSA